jgi:hypothetical protein
VQVPAGMVFGVPLGIGFFGTAFSEPALIKLASGFEAPTQVRAHNLPTFPATVPFKNIQGTNIARPNQHVDPPPAKGPDNKTGRSSTALEPHFLNRILQKTVPWKPRQINGFHPGHPANLNNKIAVRGALFHPSRWARASAPEWITRNPKIVSPTI